MPSTSTSASEQSEWKEMAIFAEPGSVFDGPMGLVEPGINSTYEIVDEAGNMVASGKVVGGKFFPPASLVNGQILRLLDHIDPTTLA